LPCFCKVVDGNLSIRSNSAGGWRRTGILNDFGSTNSEEGTIDFGEYWTVDPIFLSECAHFSQEEFEEWQRNPKFRMLRLGWNLVFLKFWGRDDVAL
jgi:hypothetical protein